MWQGETQIGLLMRWEIVGGSGKWDGYAERYAFTSEPSGSLRFRFFLKTGEPDFEVIGTGGMLSAVVADGATHEQAVRIKGTALEVA